MKRAHAEDNGQAPPTKKQNTTEAEAEAVEARFADGLFDNATLQSYTDEYARSQPYKHGVIPQLMDTALLRRVRDEIQAHLSFTPKETDIYKIHQSGDLANLDGLDDSSLARLPSLLALRDALYSAEFRKYISHVAHTGPLSGKKTDMAINIYSPGCHLLCHDDVIGTRRVSYILYLTDPDQPWRAEWGGALRLYPTTEHKTDSGLLKTPDPNFSVSIPPAFNQLSFFAVQPGESFHDVEEVYRQPIGGIDDDGSRVRMAISGWYHIPQEGEDGYEEGLEERLAEKSSLSQLQGRADAFDLPRPNSDGDMTDSTDEIDLTTEDLDLLLKYITPNYLTPDTVEELAARFADESSLQLSSILSESFSSKLKHDLGELERAQPKEMNVWQTACPPHKHRFLFRQPSHSSKESLDHRTAHVDDLIDNLLPSVAFRKWLGLVSGGLSMTRGNVVARRFRKGSDYTLATGYNENQPRLEICLSITPTKGWGGDADSTQDGPEHTSGSNGASTHHDESESVGGYEMYMAGDDEGCEVEIAPASNTGAGQRRKADPAVYRTTAGDDEDDGVLFSMPASWNTMSIVLRDEGVLRFVKYVSKSAPGDRWDIIGEFPVTGLDQDEDGEDSAADSDGDDDIDETNDDEDDVNDEDESASVDE